jgi:putative DNA primase/helicase
MTDEVDRNAAWAEVAALVDQAYAVAGGGRSAPGEADMPVHGDGDRTSSPFPESLPPIAKDPCRADPDIVRWCAARDHSDTDNAGRLIAHFGQDILAITQAKERKTLWAVWTGNHWDADTGDSRAFAIAQKVGGRIEMEVEHIGPTASEARALAAGEEIADKDSADLSPSQKSTIKLTDEIKQAIGRRKAARRKHAVTSKNKGRLEAMLGCAAPHLKRDPDAFNADRLKVAVLGHTLTFVRMVQEEVIHKGDPDLEREIEVRDARLHVETGHKRSDLITQIIPVEYDKKADCPQWRAFLRQSLPNDHVRRLVQVASGLGLLGITVQKLFFHYGAGANGKSVYMETLCRLLGEAAVTLPASSFTGEGASGGQATPDIARLYGRRFLRVKELPEGEDLRENFVKEATGGESLTARDLFAGYFDFEPLFVAHMSGNGFPRINGTDEGIWRRMAVIHWPVQVPAEARVPFEDMLARFQSEYPGILNWLIEGALIYLREGLDIPDEVSASTAEMRFEMDPTAQFCRDCVTADEQGAVRGNALYDAYVRHAEDQAGKHATPVKIQRFGRIMKKKYAWRDDRGTVYQVRLHDVPLKEPGPYPDGYGGHST